MLFSLKVGDYEEAFKSLISNYSLEATLCCEFLIKYILYSLYITKELGCASGAADDVMATGFRWCPPLAMLDAFEAVIDFRELCIQRIDKELLAKVKLNDLLSGIKKSKYDYRKFIFAKK